MGGYRHTRKLIRGDNGSITNQLRKGMNSCYFWRRNGCVIRQLSQHWQKEKQNDEARFLQVLEHDLSSLPVQAREEALAFFTEYLAEVGESSDALAELGDPHQVAQDLLSEMKAQGIPMEMREVMVLEDSKVVVTKKVSVFLEDIDLIIREADVTQLTLDYPSNLSTFLQIEQGDEQFSIKQVKPRPKQNFSFLNLVTNKVPDFLLHKLTLLVPKGLTLTDLTIHLVSSDASLEGLEVKRVSLP